MKRGEAGKAKVTVRELSALDYYSQVSGPEVCRLFGISRTTMWKWVKAGRIPEPRYIEAHEPRWRLGELVALLEKQPRMHDAPRGAKGQVEPTIQRATGKKAQSVWERLGLTKPQP